MKKTLLATLEIAIYNFAQTHNQNVPSPSFDKINKYLLSPISEREFEVLQLIYNGKTNQQIAEELFISVNTIKKHINSSYLKLDAILPHSSYRKAERFD